jgi:signal transduction histidine kinase
VASHIVQLTSEALSNVGRHARAVTCRISLRGENGSAVLEIEDDGSGFEPLGVVGRGFGLRSMNERATAIGGRFAVTAARGRGTIVRVEVPWPS